MTCGCIAYPCIHTSPWIGAQQQQNQKQYYDYLMGMHGISSGTITSGGSVSISSSIAPQVEPLKINKKLLLLRN